MEYGERFDELTFSAKECAHLCGILGAYATANPDRLQDTTEGANLQNYFVQALGRVEVAGLLRDGDSNDELLFEERKANLVPRDEDSGLRAAAIATIPNNAAAARTLTLPATGALRNAIHWAATTPTENGGLFSNQPPVGDLADAQSQPPSLIADSPDAIMSAQRNLSGMHAALWDLQLADRYQILTS